GRVRRRWPAGVAPDDARRLPKEPVEEDQDKDGNRLRAQDRRKREPHRQRHDGRPPHSVRLPKRPAGRARRISTSSEKLISSLSEGLRNTAPSDSATDTSRPPMNAPGRLPIPPMITMLKDVTESESPVGGWNGRIGATSAPAAPTHAAPTPKATA